MRPVQSKYSSMNTTDLAGKGILFVAYYYAPVSGAGLPGAMRTVKFIRNFTNGTYHILTSKPADALKGQNDALNHLSLPVNGEIVHRSGQFDLLGTLFKLRDSLKNKLKEKKTKERPAATTTPFTSISDDVMSSPKKSLLQRIKDFIYYLNYFPDNESPWIIGATWIGFQIARRKEINAIFATGSPWSGLIVGLMVSKLSGKPLIIDFRDPWINNPFHQSKGKMLDRWAQYLEKKLIKHAAVVSLNTDALYEEVASRYPDYQSKFIVLPNGFDSNEISNTLETCNSTDHDQMVLAHAGFLYGPRDPDSLLKAIRSANQRLKERGHKIRIRFDQIGNISMPYNIEERYIDLIEQGYFRIIKQVPYSECLALLANSHLLVNIQPKTRTQIPSKLYDYLALDRPILNITPKDGALGKLIEKYSFGQLIEIENPTEIEEYLFNLAIRETPAPFEGYANKEAFNIKNITAELGKHILKVTQSDRGYMK